MKRVATVFSLAMILVVGLVCLAGGVPGCASTPQGDLDRAEVLYGSTLGALNDAYIDGTLSAKAYHEHVTPLRRAARGAIDGAKSALARGDKSRAVELLAAANGALQQLAIWKTTIASTRPSAAIVDPVSIGLALLTLIAKLAPLAGKLVSGKELSDEERALAEKYSAEETVRADDLDKDALGKIG